MYSNEIVCDILEYIEININSKITIENISKKFNYNRYYLMKLFKREIKISIIDYINNLRIYNSLKDIKNNNTLLKTAISNGFYSLEYFSEMFKNIVGINPSTYKKIINYDRNISDKDMDKYTNNITKLKLLIEFTNKYKLNRKTNKVFVKKLSIFK